MRGWLSVCIGSIGLLAVLKNWRKDVVFGHCMYKIVAVIWESFGYVLQYTE
jgi:hypothetical protein